MAVDEYLIQQEIVAGLTGKAKTISGVVSEPSTSNSYSFSQLTIAQHGPSHCLVRSLDGNCLPVV